MCAVPTFPSNAGSVPVDRSGTIKMSWTAPVVPTGELPITGYSIQYHIRGSGVSGYQYMSAMQSSAEVTGLLPGTEYRVYIASVNAIGTGLYCCVGTPIYVTPNNGKSNLLQYVIAEVGIIKGIAWQRPPVSRAHLVPNSTPSLHTERLFSISYTDETKFRLNCFPRPYNYTISLE